MTKATKEEIFWGLAARTVLNEFTCQICRWKMPLGKYEGMQVADVPTAYLFETIADMRPSFFVIAVRRMLEDDCVMRLMLLFSNASGQIPRDITITQMLKACFGDESAVSSRFE